MGRMGKMGRMGGVMQVRCDLPAPPILPILYRGAGIRTRDLLLPKQARYRTAPHPAIHMPATE